MTSSKPSSDTKQQDRRSGFNRRWIKSHYSGQERRTVKDRREGMPARNLPVPEDINSKKMVGFEKLVVSTTIQLEALTRLLIAKGIIEENELLEMMNEVQTEYHGIIKA